ncbi:hypothetical protein RYX36_023774 [Vicia faba]
MVDSNNKRDEVMNIEDQYQEILEKADDDDFDEYIQSLCNLGTAWLELRGENTFKRMDSNPESNS